MSSFAEGQVHQLMDAFEGSGYTPAHLTQIGQNPTLRREILGVLAGTHEVVPITHRIDTDAAPYIPDGWTIEEHRGDGILEWDASKVKLYLDDAQMNGKRIEGNLLRKRLAKKLVLNASVLDFLLANPQHIPEIWKADDRGNRRYIFFWGTIYRNTVGNLYVRYLCWFGDRWGWFAYWLVNEWDGKNSAALRAS